MRSIPPEIGGIPEWTLGFGFGFGPGDAYVAQLFLGQAKKIAALFADTQKA